MVKLMKYLGAHIVNDSIIGQRIAAHFLKKFIFNKTNVKSDICFNKLELCENENAETVLHVEGIIKVKSKDVLTLIDALKNS